jgi:hypothetical protein
MNSRKRSVLVLWFVISMVSAVSSGPLMDVISPTTFAPVVYVRTVANARAPAVAIASAPP